MEFHTPVNVYWTPAITSIHCFMQLVLNVSTHMQWSHPALKILVSVAVMTQTAATIMLHIQLTVTVLASLSQSGLICG